MYKCRNCGEDIPPARQTKKYCSESCSISYRRRLKKGFDWEKDRNRKCLICNKDYIAKDIRSDCCGPGCKIEKQRRINADVSKKVTSEQRKEKHNKLIETGYLYYRKYTDIKQLAICPGCKRKRIISMPEPGWTGNGIPRIRCNNWPYCARYGYEYDCDETAIPEIYESGNRAAI